MEGSAGRPRAPSLGSDAARLRSHMTCSGWPRGRRRRCVNTGYAASKCQAWVRARAQGLRGRLCSRSRRGRARRRARRPRAQAQGRQGALGGGPGGRARGGHPRRRGGPGRGAPGRRRGRLRGRLRLQRSRWPCCPRAVAADGPDCSRGGRAGRPGFQSWAAGAAVPGECACRQISLFDASEVHWAARSACFLLPVLAPRPGFQLLSERHHDPRKSSTCRACCADCVQNRR